MEDREFKKNELNIINVNVQNPYKILIQKGLLSNVGKLIKDICSAQKVCIISDSNVFPIYGNKIKEDLINSNFKVFEYIFEAGEKSKVINTVIDMVEFLAKNNFTRSDIVIALGGGVCGDMAGFTSSIYLRGIKYVQIPTSLLSQVDSSVGGKTAVDLPEGKNLCGSFYQPSLVIIDSDVLNTLPEREFSAGLAEAIKMGCIKSKCLFDKILNNDAKDIIDEIIFECISLKADVVEKDERDMGERAILNFGHTVGHAIEKLHRFSDVVHGEAVGIGMVMVTKASEDNLITKKGEADKIIKILKKYNLPCEDKNSIKEIIKQMNTDKKNTGKEINFIIISEIGKGFIKPIRLSEIEEFFHVN